MNNSYPETVLAAGSEYVNAPGQIETSVDERGSASNSRSVPGRHGWPSGCFKGGSAVPESSENGVYRTTFGSKSTGRDDGESQTAAVEPSPRILLTKSPPFRRSSPDGRSDRVVRPIFFVTTRCLLLFDAVLIYDGGSYRIDGLLRLTRTPGLWLKLLGTGPSHPSAEPRIVSEEASTRPGTVHPGRGTTDPA